MVYETPPGHFPGVQTSATPTCGSFPVRPGRGSRGLASCGWTLGPTDSDAWTNRRRWFRVGVAWAVRTPVFFCSFSSFRLFGEVEFDGFVYSCSGVTSLCPSILWNFPPSLTQVLDCEDVIKMRHHGFR